MLLIKSLFLNFLRQPLPVHICFLVLHLLILSLYPIGLQHACGKVSKSWSHDRQQQPFAKKMWF